MLQRRKAIAFVSAVFPLCLIDAAHEHSSALARLATALIVVSCRSLNACQFRVDRALLEDIWGYTMSEMIDLEKMSAANLWYLTVSARPDRSVA